MECVTCVSVWIGVEGECVTGLGLGFTNSGGTWGNGICVFFVLCV